MSSQAKGTARQAAIEEVKTTPYSWFVAGLVLLTYAVSFICRNVWQTAIPVAAESLGLSLTAAGGLMTAFYIGYVLSNLFTGFVVDRIGPRLTLSLATVLTGLFTLGIPFIPGGYPTIFVLRVLAGAASGPLFAGVAKYQISYFSPATRTTALGLMMSGPALGSTIASAALAPIIKNNWMSGFTVAAIITLISAVVFFIFAKEQGASASRSQKTSDPAAKEAERKGLQAVFGKRSFIIGTVACFLSIGGNMGFTTYIISYFTMARGFTLETAALIYGASSAVGLFSGVLSGIVADLLKRKKLVCYIGAISSVVCTILLMTVTSTSALWVIMIMRTLLGALMGNPLNGLQTQAAAGPYAGRAMGLYNGIAQAGSVIFPLVFGLILDMTNKNFTIMIIAVAVATAICGVLISFMDEGAPVVQQKAKA